MMFQGCKLAS